MDEFVSRFENNQFHGGEAPDACDFRVRYQLFLDDNMTFIDVFLVIQIHAYFHYEIFDESKRRQR